MNTGEVPSAIAEDEMSMLVNLMPIGNATLRKVYPYSNDLVTLGSAEQKWMPSTVYSVNARVIPVAGVGSFIYICIQAGTSGATEPVWPVIQGQTIIDGAVIWMACSLKIRRMFVVNINNVLSIVAFTDGGAAYNINITTWAYTLIVKENTLIDPKPAQWKNERMLVIDTNNYYDWDGTTWKITDNGEIKTIVINAAGMLYQVDDILNVIQENGDDGTVKVTAVDTGGVVTQIELRTMGRGYSVATGLATTYYAGSGAGSGLTLNLTAIQSLGIKGTSICVFKNSVWIGNNRTVIFSASDSYTDFTTDDGGGAFIINSPNLRQQVRGMYQLQDFLYVLGDHSCSIIAGITLSSQSSSFFTVTETITHIGLSDYDSMQAIDNMLLLSNDTGVHSVSNATYYRLHDLLDGLVIDKGFGNVGCTANIYGINCYGWLTNIYNQFALEYQKWVFFFFRRGEQDIRMFAVDYGLDLNYLCFVESTVGAALYGSYSNKIIRMFDPRSDNPITAWIRTRAEDFGLPIQDKATQKFGTSVAMVNANPLAFSLTIDADYPYVDISYIVNPGLLRWINNSGQTLTWTSSMSNPLLWSIGAYPSDIYTGKDCGGRGKHILIDLQETSADTYTIQSLYYEGITRARW